MNEFDQSLTLESGGPGLWHGIAAPCYDGTNGMWGGWTTAVMLKAVLDDPEVVGSPIALTVNFLGQVPAERPIVLRTQPLSSSRSIAQWRCDLTVKDAEQLAAAAIIVLGNRRETDRFVEAAMPDVVAPEALRPAKVLPRPALQRVEQRRTDGADNVNSCAGSGKESTRHVLRLPIA